MKQTFLTALLLLAPLGALPGAELRAGTGKVDITDRAAGPVNDARFAKAPVLRSGGTTAGPITVVAVAIGEIGRIGPGFLATVRAQFYPRRVK